MNIIPVIPLHNFKDMEPPTCDDLKEARDLASEYLEQFRLCRQCRADAIGVQGHESMGSPEPKVVPEYFHG